MHNLQQIFDMTKIKQALIDLLQVLLSVQLKAVRNRFLLLSVTLQEKLKLMIHRNG